MVCAARCADDDAADGRRGQFGQVVSSFPFAWALHEYGWQPAFITLGIAGVIRAPGIGVRNRPERRHDGKGATEAGSDHAMDSAPNATDELRTAPSTPSFTLNF